jgi:phosphate:Na+ symporter
MTTAHLIDAVQRRGHILMVLSLGAVLWFAAAPSYVLAADDDQAISWWTIGMQVFGGLAIFLFGMDQMAGALKQAAGNRMKHIISTLTTNRVMGLLTGTFVTAIIQSSSVTTVLLVGFVTAGLMSLSQAIGVILGADIGTTITAQIIAFKVTKYALLLIAVGFLLMFTGRKDVYKQYGAMMMGAGMIFFGMGVMSEAVKPLRDYEPFVHMMREVSNPAIGILVAAVFTALIQASAATIGLVIAMALQGLITLETGIALALGANIGTCITAGLAAIGKPREAVRVAVAHVTFKIVGVLLIVGFIPPFADLIRAISPQSPELSGFERLAAETPRQIANAHTVFNVAIALVFLPFATLFARFCEWVVPDRPLAEPTVIQPRYLDKELLSTPPLAIDRTRREIGRLGVLVERMLDRAMPAVLSGSREDLRTLEEMDADIDILHGHIVAYLAQISVGKLSTPQSHEIMHLMQAVNHLEQIGDIIETNMVKIGLQRIEEGVVVSKATMAMIQRYHEKVARALQTAVQAVSEEDPKAALTVKHMKQDMAELAEETARHEVGRLVASEPNRLRTFTREMEIIENLSRIYRLCRKIARAEWVRQAEPIAPEAA